MLPYMADPERQAKKFKQQMSHKIKMFRFSNRTKVVAGEEFTAEQFFSEKQEQASSLGRLSHSKPLKTDDFRARASEHSEQRRQNLKETQHFLKENFKFGQQYLEDKLKQSPL